MLKRNRENLRDGGAFEVFGIFLLPNLNLDKHEEGQHYTCGRSVENIDIETNSEQTQEGGAQFAVTPSR